jgi:hypothetical protein
MRTNKEGRAKARRMWRHHPRLCARPSILLTAYSSKKSIYQSPGSHNLFPVRVLRTFLETCSITIPPPTMKFSTFALAAAVLASTSSAFVAPAPRFAVQVRACVRACFLSAFVAVLLLRPWKEGRLSRSCWDISPRSVFQLEDFPTLDPWGALSRDSASPVAVMPPS